MRCGSFPVGMLFIVNNFVDFTKQFQYIFFFVANDKIYQKYICEKIYVYHGTDLYLKLFFQFYDE